MYRITGTPRAYAWGSTTAIHELMGTRPDGRPLAELWFGAHPSAPAQVQRDGVLHHDGNAVPEFRGDLRGVIAADPVAMLGEDVVARFGERLPYLLKVIAPANPLSLQVHPSLERARAGFAEENAAGLPVDAPTRNYVDANHKPELVYALTTFRAMSGFRAPRRAAELVDGLDSALARRMCALLRENPTAAGVRAAFSALLVPESRPTPEEIDELVRACGARLAAGSPSPRADGTVLQLAEAYPDDPGVATSLLLNPVTLQPGDAMFVPAGAVHAYLSGVAVEIMASSDNVLRAGLTPKHIDIPEMLENVDYVAAPPIRIAPEVFHGSTEVYYAPVDDFELSITTSTSEHATCPLPGRGPRILLCLDGAATVTSDSTRVELSRGQAVFVPASQDRLRITGGARVVQADVP